MDGNREALEAACLEGLVSTPHGYRYRPRVGADAVECIISARAEQAERERDEAREALVRVEALVVPQWHTNRGHEYDYLADAYAAGRNDFIDRIRLALADPNPTDTEGDDRV